MDAYGNATVAGIQEFIMVATNAELHLLDTIVRTGFRKLLTDDQWATLRAVQGVSHMARTCDNRMQYFSVLFGSPIRSGLRVVAAENVNGVADMLYLFGTHLNDFSVGRYFFKNGDRMHEDLLAVAGSAVLEKMFHKKVPGCPIKYPMGQS
jgi:copper homeostasis protein CutC